MRQTALARLGVLVAGLGWFGVCPAQADKVVFARDLALSPNGHTLAFSWAGDIWTVSAQGGLARRLTVHPGSDRYPVWSPNGEFIAFGSRRHGPVDVFVMRANGQDIRRLTYADASEVPSSWSPNNETVFFHAFREGDVYREPRVYQVPAIGGQSVRALDCFASEAVMSPDGSQFAFIRGSLPWVRWSRRNYRGPANADLWLCPANGSAFSRLTTFDGTDRWPQWDVAGDGVYFLSDRSGTMNVWYLQVGRGEPEQVSRMTGDDVRDYAVSADGETLAFTHWEDVYVMCTSDRRARMIQIEATDDFAETDIDLRTFTNDADEQEPSPDGEQIALVVRGEIVVTRTEDDKPTRQITDSPARDHDITWSPDGAALYFVSDREGQEDIYRATSAEEPPKPLADSLRFKLERVTDSPELEYHPSVSPDGKQLAYLRTRGNFIIRDLKTGEERCLFESWNPPTYEWSPNSKWIAYQVEDHEHNSDVWIVPADGSADPVNISQHPDYDGNPQWSADGQILAFYSRRHGFDTDLYMVFLSPELNEKAGYELKEYFEKQAKAVGKFKSPKDVIASGEIVLPGHVPTTQPVETQPATEAPATTQPAETQPTATQPTSAPSEPDDLQARVQKWIKEYLAEQDKPAKKKPEKKDEKEEEKAEHELEYAYELQTCYQRIRRVTSMPGNQSGFALAPDGEHLAFISSHEGGAKLYLIKWNGEDRKRIVNGSVGALRWTPNGKRLFYLQRGVPRSCSASGSGTKTHGFRAKLAISRSAEAAQKFSDGARHLGMRFYHPNMKGLDWPALTRKYRELALQTRTTEEFNEVFNMLLGELNASHLGIYGPRDRVSEHTGYLGCWFDREYPGPGLKVSRVLPRSPAARTESTLHAGDIILKAGDNTVGPQYPIEAALINTVNDPVILTLIPSPERKKPENTPETSPATQPTSAPTTQKTHQEPDTIELVIRPTSFGRIQNLMYDDWVEQNRAYVERQTDGRVGYLHIRAMGEAQFEQFERDLYAAAHGRDGLIIDVRSNGGGWTADWVMAVLMVKRHAYTIPRGGVPGYPQGRLIFYSWTKPATMMCNQQSFSNAEIVSHAFKNLNRGPLVGMQTYGGVISTGGHRLIDGALVRMPTRGWYTLPDGADMENAGAMPDVQVPILPDDEVRGRRPQLDAAIKATLSQLDTQAGEGP